VTEWFWTENKNSFSEMPYKNSYKI
jgi:hypothetical protein